jgi:hypothetical protein
MTNRLLAKFFGKALPHALWAAQNAVYGDGARRPFVITGVYPQRLRVTRENVPKKITRQFAAALKAWKSHLANTESVGDADLAKRIGVNVAYYERELDAIRKRWP